MVISQNSLIPNSFITPSAFYPPGVLCIYCICVVKILR